MTAADLAALRQAERLAIADMWHLTIIGEPLPPGWLGTLRECHLREMEAKAAEGVGPERPVADPSANRGGPLLVVSAVVVAVTALCVGLARWGALQ
jgi:hypothetical protein